MKPPPPTLEQIFDDHIRILATVLRPGTVKHYRCSVR